MAEEKIAFDFGMRIRQLRKERGLSQAVFAETVYRYENNLQDPSLERTKQIALILRTSLDYLTGLEDGYTVRLPQLSKEQRDVLNEFLRVFVKEDS